MSNSRTNTIVVVSIATIVAFLLIHREHWTAGNGKDRYTDAAIESERLLKARDFTALYRLEAQWRSSIPSTDREKLDYLRILRSGLLGRRDGHTGDTLVTLQAAAPYLRHMYGEDDHHLLPDFADEFLRIHLLRRARELYSQMSTQPAGDLPNISLALQRFGSPDLKIYPANSRDAVRQGILDVLDAPPDNHWYNEFSAPQPHSTSEIIQEPKSKFERDVEQMTAKIRAAEQELFPPLPQAPAELFLPRMLAGNTSVITNDRHYFTATNEPLTSISLSGSDLLSSSDLNKITTSDRSLSDIREPIAKLLRAADRANPVGSFEIAALQHLNGYTLALLEFQETYRVLVYSQYENAKLWTLTTDYQPILELEDLFGNGQKTVLTISYSGGVRAALTATIYSLSDGTVMWSQGPLRRGSIQLARFGLRDTAQLLVREGTSRQIVDCGQCPETYRISIYSASPQSSSFHLVSIHDTSAELLVGGDGGLLGVARPQTTIRLSEKSIPEALVKLQGSMKSSKIDADRVGALYDQISDYADALAQEGANRQASELYRQLVSLLAFHRDKSDIMAMSISAQRQAFSADISNNDFVGASKTLEESWFVAASSKTPDGESWILNSRAVIAMASGRLGDAYRSLTEARLSNADESVAVAGNLALYFLQSGDAKSAYSAATEAIDIAMRAGRKSGEGEKGKTKNGSADEIADDQDDADDPVDSPHAMIDMIIAASAAQRLGEPSIALDWLLRVVRAARGDSASSSSAAMLAAEAAARVALATNEPELAMRLLDDGIASADKASWRAEGGSVLLLYGQALSTQNEDTSAETAWNSASRLAQGVSYDDYIVAEFSLAKLSDKRGNIEEATQHAENAFKMITRGRLAIWTESQKLTFLGDRKDVVELLLQLYQRRGLPADKLLATIEQWKLRTFLDIYGSTATQSTTQTEIPDTPTETKLRQVLSSNESFIDYFAGKQFSVAITVRPGMPTIAAPVRSNASEIVADVDAVRSFMDLRSAVSLQQIRNDKITPAFDVALERLYDVLLKPSSAGVKGSRRLIISPDEAMVGVPWSALKSGGRSLIEDYESLIIPSAELYVRGAAKDAPPEANRSKGISQSLLLGAFWPVSSSEVARTIPLGGLREEIGNLPPLTNGLKEVQRVGAALKTRGPVTYLLDSSYREQVDGVIAGSPSRENALALFPKFSVIHVVAHGIFSPTAPMNSSIFLAPERDGRTLLARDVLQLRLDRVDVVSLAACQTAYSTRSTGAEPFGFLRALLGSGVSSVLLTEWEIDDATSVKLFGGFYGRYGRMPKAQALRESQLAIRSAHSHPYYWASVSLFGQSR